jgi:hypothetical protein
LQTADAPRRGREGAKERQGNCTHFLHHPAPLLVLMIPI